ncbi:carbohydrate ABC transporter permease [Mycoplasma phocimorsus]|uniref:carbohydrate ABC transporter permease n=1 Tax=Mycoplasma phocimorsus TaxID=3045839 RepID=UPI0024C02135|nr:ABC transporter permease subunit [Mycoplasma phocimorsus]MDJ1646687.1 ABC transporter permease subunit [Mycoplasma phocimorsus]
MSLISVLQQNDNKTTKAVKDIKIKEKIISLTNHYKSVKKRIKTDLKEKNRIASTEYKNEILVLKSLKRLYWNEVKKQKAKLEYKIAQEKALVKIIDGKNVELELKNAIEKNQLETLIFSQSNEQENINSLKELSSKALLNTQNKDRIKKYKQEFQMEIKNLKEKYFYAEESRKNKTIKLIKKLKEKLNLELKQIKKENKLSLIENETKYKNAILNAKKDYISALHFIRNNDIYLNSYGDPVSEILGLKEIISLVKSKKFNDILNISEIKNTKRNAIVKKFNITKSQINNIVERFQVNEEKYTNDLILAHNSFFIYKKILIENLTEERIILLLNDLKKANSQFISLNNFSGLDSIKTQYENGDFDIEFIEITTKNKKFFKELKSAALKIKKCIKTINFTQAEKLIELTLNYDTYLEKAKIMDRFAQNREIIKSKLESKVPNKDKIKNQQHILLNDYREKVLWVKNSDWTKEAKKNKLEELKFKFKTSFRAVILNDEYYSLKDRLRFSYLEEKRELDKVQKINETTIDDEIKKIPTKAKKGSASLATIASFLFPGIGQIINKEWLKGGIFLIISLILYIILVPYIFGAYPLPQTVEISGVLNGIFGFWNLSPSIDIGGGFGINYHDPRIRIIEGIISIIFIVFWILIAISASADAYRSGKLRELGYRQKNNRDTIKFLKGQGLPLLFSLPAFIMIMFIVILPLIATILIAFTNYGAKGHQPPSNPLNWIGFDNFKDLFTGSSGRSFSYVTSWTLIWTFSVTIITIVVGTLLALIVDNPRMKAKKLWSLIFILPWSVPAFATILFFKAAFVGAGTQTYYNEFFHSNVAFASNYHIMRILLISIQVWLGHSYVFLLVSGIKKGIPEDLYEASSIDGSSQQQKFSKITAPLILQQIAPLLIGQFLFNFNNFGLIFMFSGGDPQPSEFIGEGSPGATDIIISLIFKITTAENAKIGLASAFTMIMSVFIVGLSLIMFLRTKAFKKEE